MKKLSFLLAFTVAATTTVAVLAGDAPDPATLSQISGYRQWKRVNAEPIKVEVPITATAVMVSMSDQIAV